MRYVIKIRDLYLTPDGTLSPNQSDAIKVDSPGPIVARQVKLRSSGLTNPPGYTTGDTSNRDYRGGQW